MMKRLRATAWLPLVLALAPQAVAVGVVTASPVFAYAQSGSSGGSSGDVFGDLERKGNDVNTGFGRIAIPAFTILFAVVAFQVATRKPGAWAWVGAFVVGVMLFIKRTSIMDWIQR